MSEEYVTGGCLCGEIGFRVSNAFPDMYFCSCRQCQQTSGSAFASNLFAPCEAFSWTKGAEQVARYKVPGRNITRAFCRTCGSGLPYVSDDGARVLIPAGP